MFALIIFRKHSTISHYSNSFHNSVNSIALNRALFSITLLPEGSCLKLSQKIMQDISVWE